MRGHQPLRDEQSERPTRRDLTIRINQGRVCRRSGQQSQRQHAQPSPQHDRAEARCQSQQRKRRSNLATASDSTLNIQQIAENPKIHQRHGSRDRQEQRQARKAEQRADDPHRTQDRMPPRHRKRRQSVGDKFCFEDWQQRRGFDFSGLFVRDENRRRRWLSRPTGKWLKRRSIGNQRRQLVRRMGCPPFLRRERLANAWFRRS